MSIESIVGLLFAFTLAQSFMLAVLYGNYYADMKALKRSGVPFDTEQSMVAIYKGWMETNQKSYEAMRAHHSDIMKQYWATCLRCRALRDQLDAEQRDASEQE